MNSTRKKMGARMTSELDITTKAITLQVPLTRVTVSINGQAVEMNELAITLPFARKPMNLADFNCGTPQRVLVHAHKELTAEEFDAFARNLLKTTHWIQSSVWGGNIAGAHTCIMVSAPNRPILFVDTQGYDYARYVARLG
jgi:hypothetical protein